MRNLTNIKLFFVALALSLCVASVASGGMLSKAEAYKVIVGVQGVAK